MLYSCTRIETVGVKGLTCIPSPQLPLTYPARNSASATDILSLATTATGDRGGFRPTDRLIPNIVSWCRNDTTPPATMELRGDCVSKEEGGGPSPLASLRFRVWRDRIDRRSI